MPRRLRRDGFRHPGIRPWCDRPSVWRRPDGRTRAPLDTPSILPRPSNPHSERRSQRFSPTDSLLTGAAPGPPSLTASRRLPRRRPKNALRYDKSGKLAVAIIDPEWPMPAVPARRFLRFASGGRKIHIRL